MKLVSPPISLELQGLFHKRRSWTFYKYGDVKVFCFTKEQVRYLKTTEFLKFSVSQKILHTYFSKFYSYFFLSKRRAFNLEINFIDNSNSLSLEKSTGSAIRNRRYLIPRAKNLYIKKEFIY